MKTVALLILIVAAVVPCVEEPEQVRELKPAYFTVKHR